MVFISWVVSILLSCPQAMMFRKLKHPTMEFHQCTTTMVIESYSDIVIENGQAHIRFYGIDPSILYQLYSGSFLFFVYFFPLFCLIISYTIIIIIVKRFYYWGKLFKRFLVQLILKILGLLENKSCPKKMISFATYFLFLPFLCHSFMLNESLTLSSLVFKGGWCSPLHLWGFWLRLGLWKH